MIDRRMSDIRLTGRACRNAVIPASRAESCSLRNVDLRMRSTKWMDGCIMHYVTNNGRRNDRVCSNSVIRSSIEYATERCLQQLPAEVVIQNQHGWSPFVETGQDVWTTGSRSATAPGHCEQERWCQSCSFIAATLHYRWSVTTVLGYNPCWRHLHVISACFHCLCVLLCFSDLVVDVFPLYELLLNAMDALMCLALNVRLASVHAPLYELLSADNA